MKTKKCKPILVPQDKATWPNCLWLGKYTKHLRLDISYNDKPRSINPFDDSMLPQQLILISLEDDKIKVGDTVYSEILNQFEVLKEMPNGDLKYWFEGIYKLIATQSQLSPDYIQQFVDEYNKGEVKDVEIEIEEYHGINTSIAEINAISGDNSMGWKGRGDLRDYRIKLNNGFVTIVNKESILYTEDEVFDYCLKALETGFDLSNTPLPRLNEKSGKEYFKKWFELNKKKQ